MGSLQDRVCCKALNCFTWLLSPACITSFMWKVPGSLESTIMTTDKSGSLAERHTPSTRTERTEREENCLDSHMPAGANFQDSLTCSLQMRPNYQTTRKRSTLEQFTKGTCIRGVLNPFLNLKSSLEGRNHVQDIQVSHQEPL